MPAQRIRRVATTPITVSEFIISNLIQDPLPARPGGPLSGPTGRVYRLAWSGLAGVVATPAAVVGLLGVSVSEALGLVAVVVGCSWARHHLADGMASTTMSGARSARTLLLGVGSCLALVGLSGLLGQTGVLLAAGLAVTSPAAIAYAIVGTRSVWSRLLPPSRWTPATLSSPVGPVAAAGFDAARRTATGAMTDAELCLAWRSSFTALQRCDDLPARFLLIGARQGYLDELERRNPYGFARWLYEGARPGSDPSRYLARSRPASPEPADPRP